MSATDPRIVREHWRGGGDVVELIGIDRRAATSKKNQTRTDLESRSSESAEQTE
jgi:hypothetical protein